MTGNFHTFPATQKHRLIAALERREAANEAAMLRPVIESAAPFKSIGDVASGIIARLQAQRTGNAA